MALPSEAHIVLSHIRIEVDEFLQDAVVAAPDAGKPRSRPRTHRLRVRTIHRLVVAGEKLTDAVADRLPLEERLAANIEKSVERPVARVDHRDQRIRELARQDEVPPEGILHR